MKNGQTLLESIVAIAIILIGMVALITLLNTVYNTAVRTSKDEQAMYLAQEAIEAARYVRDSNWLKRENGDMIPYYTGLRSGTDFSAIYVWNPKKNQTANPDTDIVFNFNVNDINDINGKAKVYQDNNDKYYRQSVDPSGLTATPFSRLITFYPICYNTSTKAESVLTTATDCTNTAGVIEIGVQVLVQINWQQGVQTQQRFYEENIYDWKYANATMAQ